MSVQAVKPDTRDTAAAKMLRDDKSETAEAAQKNYEEINRQANEVVQGWLKSLGPSAYLGAATLFAAGCFVGYKRTIDKDANISRRAMFIAVKALGASSLLIGGATFLGVVAFRKFTGIKSIPEFNAKMKESVSPVASSARTTVEKTGLGQKPVDPNAAKPSNEEIESLDQTLAVILQEAGDIVAPMETAQDAPKEQKPKRPPPAWAKWFVKDESKKEGTK